MEHLICETKEISGRHAQEEINKYLKLGWIIVEKWVVGFGHPMTRDETLHILLGWIDRSRPAQHPTEPESQTSEINNRCITFEE